MNEPFEFRISRVFDIERERMFELWTRAEHLTHWFGPKETELFACHNDLTVGGMMLYGMRAENGDEHWGRWVYREITPPRRLVFVVSFANAEGEVVRNPWSIDWPLLTLSVVTFEAVGSQTRVTVVWTPLDATDTERRSFEEGSESMGQGWSGTYDQLEAYVQRLGS